MLTLPRFSLFLPRATCFIGAAAALLLAGCATRQPGSETGVSITRQPGQLCVAIAGKPFTEYHYADGPKPYLYPLIGPTGAGMTRNFPMTTPPGEEHDHPHHRSFWFAHGLVNGVDFWTERPTCGRIVHDKFLKVRGGADSGVIRARNQWIGPDGRIICTDATTLTFHETGDSNRLVDFEIKLHADHGNLVFGDTKEGTMALRVVETMRLTRANGGTNPDSHIINSEGARDRETWGKRARWCDYSGRVGGAIAGITIFDHPDNPRFPTWWMARDYGLFAANPFGQHEFERLSNSHAGDLEIPSGGTLTLRYRIYLHAGPADVDVLNQLFREFATASSDQ